MTDLTKIMQDTVQQADPEVRVRIYTVEPSGATGHSVVGGESRMDCRSKLMEEMDDDIEVVDVEEYKEGEINHPLMD